MNRLAAFVAGFALAAAGTLAFPGRASAAVRSYFATGTAHFVSPTDFVGSGRATHLGHYSEQGSVAFTSTSNPAVLQVTGTTAYFAANGDRLDAHVSGTLNQATGVVLATLTYVGGTGRFDDASGQSSLAGQMEPNGTIRVTVTGVIDY
jgi:hypothetical protein